MKDFFKNTKPFGQLVTLILLVVIFFVIASGLLTIASLFGVDLQETRSLQWTQALVQIFVFLIPAIIFGYLFSDNTCVFFKLDFGRRKWVMALWAMLILLCVIPLTDWLAQVNDAWHFPASMASLEDSLRRAAADSEMLVESFLMQGGVGSLIINILILALLPALCEEFFFRGALQQWFMRWIKSPHLAIIITAAVFSLAHGEFFSFLPRFLLGIVLGYLFYYTGSMLVNVIVHFLNNAAVVVIYYLYSTGTIDENFAENLDAPWYLVLVGTVLAITVFYRFVLHPKNGNRLDKQSENLSC